MMGESVDGATVEGYLIVGLLLLTGWAWMILRWRRAQTSPGLIAAVSHFTSISPAGVRSLRRALPALLAAATLFYLTAIVGQVQPEGWRYHLGWVLLHWCPPLMMAAAAVLACSVFAANRPRLIAAPRHRDEPGYFARQGRDPAG